MTSPYRHRADAGADLPYLLLTGATGFLGRVLLRDLMLSGERVAVLVRSKGPMSAHQRVARIVEHWRALGYRIDEPLVLEGGLDEPDLRAKGGHESGAWPRIDRVLHNAASVRLSGEPSSGEPFRSNVAGTRRLIEWARRSGVGALHYVSTAYVSGSRTGVVLETELDRGQSFKNAYEKSKFDAEMEVRRCGLDFVVYRPSIVVGPPSEGMAPAIRGLALAANILEWARAAGPTHDIARTLSTFGASAEWRKNLVPVDWVSAVIVDRVRAVESLGRTYHVTSPAPTSLESLVLAIDKARADGAAPEPADPSQMQTFASEYGAYVSDDPVFDRAHLDRDVPHLPCPAIDIASLVPQIATARAPRPRKPKGGSLIHEPLAIVGLACRLPGAHNLDEYWQLIKEGRVSIGALPESRLDRALYFDSRKGRVGRTYSDLGGIVPDLPPSPALASILGDRLGQVDDCHRILADVAIQACRDAGFDPNAFPDERAGIYVGHAGGSPRGGDAVVSTFADTMAGLLRRAFALKTTEGPTVEASVRAFADSLKGWPGHLDGKGEPRLEAREAARLLADILRTNGPAMIVDAACASSLTAIGLAALALQTGEIKTAVVAGASMASAQNLVLFSQARSCSATGSRPFDEDADGLVASEGYVVLIVKTLAQATHDGDDIKAVLRGLGMSSDGRALSLWAPRKEGQIAALEHAYAELDPGGIDYIEAHATSTQVGDATELEALAHFFRPHVGGRRVPIGSVKGNIGHTLETAGLASLVKVVLALRHGIAPPNASLKVLNRDLPWSTLPFEILSEPTPLERPASRPLAAGVSAFGIGGLNVHIVVEAPSSTARSLRATRPTAAPPEEIAIVGRGLVTAGGASVRDFARFLSRGGSAIGPPPPETGPGRTLGAAECLGGYLRDYAFDWRKLMLPPKQMERANPLRFLLLDAVNQALREAAIPKRGKHRSRCAVVIGVNFSSDFGNDLQLGLRLPEIGDALARVLRAHGFSPSDAGALIDTFEKTFLEAKPALLDETGGFTSSSLASGIAKTFDLMGGALAIDAGRDTGDAALDAAASLLRSGAVDSVVCAGGQRSMDLARYDLARRRGELPPSGSGEWPGEGAAAVVLRRLSDARRAGATILGTLGRATNAARAAMIRTRVGDVDGAIPILTLIDSTHELRAAPSSSPRVADAPRSGPRIAFAFPGQGAHYPQMFETLNRDSHAARDVFERANVAASRMNLEPLSALVGAGRLERDPMAAQLCTLVADVMAFAALEERGIRPDCVFGHSFGEMAALVAAKAWSLESAMKIAHIRAAAIAKAPPGRLLALSLSAQAATSLIAESGLQVFITHANAPSQTVVGGSLDAMTDLEALLATRRIRGVPLAVAGALHTPLMASAREELARALEEETLAPPTTLLLTGAANLYTSEPDEIRASLARQLTEPVRYQAMVERSVADGIRVLIEAGPRSILTGLHRRILNGRDCRLLSTDETVAGFASPLMRIASELQAARPASRPQETGPRGGPPGIIVEFDATARRTSRTRSKKRGPHQGDGQPNLAERAAPGGLLRFLLDFLVDHTGYPEEVIELDWDFEADLGIDSIKRAQLFGEVADLLRLGEERVEALLNARTLRAVLTLAGEAPETTGLTQPPASAAPSRRKAPESNDGPVTRRHVLALVDAPLRRRSGGVARLVGPSLILGSNPAAEALRARIEALGHRAFVLPTSEDIPNLIREVDAIAALGPPSHLFLTTPRDAEARTTFDHRDWSRRRVAGVEAPFEVCKRWVMLLANAGGLADASVTGVISASGSHGVSGTTISAESGAISGLCKAIGIEQWVRGFRSMRTLVIDSPADEPADDLAEAVLSELEAPSYEVEVAWSRGRRRRLGAMAMPLPMDRPDESIRRGAVWVCTGGARGATRFLAHELGRRFGLRLHLIGASPAPRLGNEVRRLSGDGLRALRLETMRLAREDGRNPVGAWQDMEKALEIEASLEEFDRHGIHARYHACDVADREALARVLDAIRAEDGAIEGLLHGAGFSRDGRIEHKRPEHVARCFRSKLDGAYHLMELTQQDPIRHLVTMGSISGRFGANGQTDYSLSNDMLAKLVSWYRGQRPEVATVNVDWHAWDDVGMATRAETRLALESIGMRFMPAAEGSAHLLAELSAGCPESEVLITDDRYARMFGLGHLISRDGLESNPAEPSTGPLLEGGRVDIAGDGVRAEVPFDPRREPFLAEHRFEGTPLLPFAVGLELLCEASAPAFGGRRARVLRDVRAIHPLWFANERPRKLRVEAGRAGEGVRASLRADVLGPDGRVIEERRTYFHGSVEWEAGDHAARSARRPETRPTDWPRVDYSTSTSGFHLGPPFQVLQRLELSSDAAWGEILAPEPSEIVGFERRSKGFVLPCAALDACFQAVGRLAAQTVQDADTFPQAVEELRLGRLPDRGETCSVEVRVKRFEPSRAHFDFILTGADDEVLLEARGYQVAWQSVDIPAGGRS